MKNSTLPPPKGFFMLGSEDVNITEYAVCITFNNKSLEKFIFVNSKDEAEKTANIYIKLSNVLDVEVVNADTLVF